VKTMLDLSKKMYGKWMIAAFAAVVASGCQIGVPDEDLGTSTTVPPPPVLDPAALLPDVEAGSELTGKPGPAATVALATSMPFVKRSDPFALLRQENAYEASQRAERFVQEGGFLTMWTPPAPPPSVAPTENVEPQPYRRLSGILIGDSVMAIVEMEDGKTYIIRPGTRIPDTEWRVISVDGDKAILKRAGNRRPTQITVRLEARPPGAGSGGNTGGGGASTGGGGTMQPPGGGGKGGGMLPGVGGG
jgi:hypothetical protein